MNCYLPEGMQIHTARSVRTLEELARARDRGDIIAATALLCDEHHNLHVSIGGMEGVIAREDAAMGIAQGTVRDIAILARVGKTVCCKVLELPPGGAVRLSRVAAQEEALGHLLRRLRPGDVVPAVVTSLAPFGAFCDIGCGVPALLGRERSGVCPVGHSRDRFHPGQPIFAVVSRVDSASQRFELSHRELLGTWAENAALFAAGQTVAGVVRGVRDYGVFVELTPNLAGLAEPDGQLEPGDRVSVYIKSVQPDRGKLKLTVLERLNVPPLPRPQPRYFQTDGRVETWQYRPGDPVTSFT